VAITRAKQHLTITHARQRMLYGRTAGALASRFLREIPEDCMVRKGLQKPKQDSYNSWGSRYGSGSEWAGFQNPPMQKKPEQYRKAEAPAKTAAPVLDLNKGDMVMHAAFGRGLVISVMKMGGDALLEIAFDDIGTKRLMAKTASAHMKKL
jgi:DNA helicase-2/ATP-dependent DNA helicase PcrA